MSPGFSWRRVSALFGAAETLFCAWGRGLTAKVIGVSVFVGLAAGFYDPEAIVGGGVDDAVGVVHEKCGDAGEVAEFFGVVGRGRCGAGLAEDVESVGDDVEFGSGFSGSRRGGVEVARAARIADVQHGDLRGRVQAEHEIFFAVALDEEHAGYVAAGDCDVADYVGGSV